MIDSAAIDRLLAPVLDRWLGLGRATTPELVITKDLAVEVPGHDEAPAATLATDHYRPAAVDRGPVVLIRTPYDKNGWLARLYGPVLARRGVQVIIQDVRGRAGSTGEFEPFRHEQHDGLATVEWIRQQSWCDGRVATAGMSYFGYTQWAIGPYVEPRLAAMAVGVTAADFRPTFYPGGTVGLQVALSWSASIGTQDDRLPPWRRIGLARRVARAMTTVPPKEADRAAIGKHVQFLTDILEHGEPTDRFWDFLDHGRHPESLGTPVSMVAGWYDIFVGQQLRDFTALQQAGLPCRLTVGPWTHGQPSSLRVSFADQVEWLVGHLVHGRQPAARPAVRIFLQKADRWLEFDQWPVPTEPRDHFLAADGRILARAPEQAGTRAFRYDPADPTPIVGGAPLNLPGGQRDNRPVEGRDDVLCYQTDPLDHDLDVIGEASAEIRVRTEHPDADVFVRVCDLEPGGRSLNVTEGLRRFRPGDRPADERGTRVASIDLLPTAYRFRKGHRIRVQISGGAFPNYLRNHQTGEPIADAIRFRPGRTEVLHDPAHPSRITLPVHRDSNQPDAANHHRPR